MTDPHSEAKFDALRNAIYHTARKDFYDGVNRSANFLVIVLGAAVAGKASKLFSMDETWLEFAVLIVATAQLTFDFGYKARTHEFLQRKYHELLAELELDSSLDGQKWKSKLQTIAADEPMPMRALDALAYNAAVDATYFEAVDRAKNRVWVPFFHRVFKNFIARNGYNYCPQADHEYWWQRMAIWISERWHGKKSEESKEGEIGGT
ncbi:hypothetical protein GA0061099_10059 [Bradyrhizobium yuanmingense]|uniref:SMODS and SLOG-associating 2TM effector domain-containing protein n=1 Tax=Bradyrhizobium yuanmingense TaxID=108015 RepID=A0A1C3VZV7_9BRAD|nr:hypothetical protein [Bradyrhizobium yuanmingense]TWI27775.1 hypothetical protein IQ15_03315 [Bradyrhizobium yuanmingense]SCB33310.1 hypothetical protein GA0061099_10059 [Bradyrhizobium yuanmingense]